ncbi:unnamed protein product, partial [Sphacelaria rigidula]
MDDPAAICGAAVVIGVPLLIWAWNNRVRYWYYAAYPIAYPGDAHTNLLTRRGKWENQTSTLRGGWTFFHAQHSHDRTEAAWAKAGKSLSLTGEAAGRQTWDMATEKEQAESPPGEEDLSFNPALNPNAGDKILRAQQLRKWTGPRPDDSKAPTNALEAAKKGAAFYQ